MTTELPPRTLRDPLRRLTATPLKTDLSIMGRRVHLESNSAALFSAIAALFEPLSESCSDPPDFLWRLVGETSPDLVAPWPEMAAFSEEGLRYVTFGQRGFFAIDLDAREAIAFLPEAWASDPVGFPSVFAATFFDLVAPALALSPISAACVAFKGRALLIFGPPRSGKTTSTYFAGKLGLEFHADQASFLDLQSDELRAWGQFWPAAFREESVQFLPEVGSAESFTYGNLTFRCFLRHPFRAAQARSVVPVGCVFLERRDARVPQLVPMGVAEREGRVRESLSFQDDARFESQYAQALRAIGKLPAYRLSYGSDPAVAATFLRNILMVHDSLEVAR